MQTCTYALLLDRSKLQLIPQVYTYYDLSAKAIHPLQLVCRKCNISTLLVVLPEDLGVDSVKQVRQILRECSDDAEFQKLIDELWIDILIVRGRSLEYRALSTVVELAKYLRKYEQLGTLLVDSSLASSQLFVHAFYRGLELAQQLGVLGGVEIKYLLLDTTRSQQMYRLAEVDLRSHKVDPCTLSVQVLELLISCPELSPSDKHRLRVLQGKIETLCERLRLGLGFEAMTELTELSSVYSRALREVDDPVSRQLLELLPITEYIPRTLTVPEVAKAVAKMLLDLGQLVPAVLFAKNFLHTFIQAWCCYFGMLDPDYCSVRTVEQGLEKLNVLSYIPDEYARKTETLLDTLLKTGFTKGLCTGIITDNLEEIGRAYCPGTLKADEIRDTVLTLLDRVLSGSPYEICTDFATGLKRVYEGERSEEK